MALGETQVTEVGAGWTFVGLLVDSQRQFAELVRQLVNVVIARWGRGQACRVGVLKKDRHLILNVYILHRFPFGG